MFDAVIVGGGPGGAFAAIGLARLGWRVALVERRAPHRPKTCGHCLNPRARPILEGAGLWPAVEALADGRTERVNVHHALLGAIGSTHAGRPSAGASLLVDRARFDQLLVDAAAGAGAHVEQPIRATAVTPTAGGVRVSVQGREGSGELRARMVIGADGLCSRVAAALGLGRVASDGRGIGFAFDLEDGGRSDFGGAIDLFLARGGYLGVVRTSPGRLHVAGFLRRAADDPLAFTRQTAARFDALRAAALERVERGAVANLVACGTMPWRPARVACRHGALVGDAAGYVEPFTGEGMSWALESSAVLVGVARVASAPGAWSDALAACYAREHARHIRRRQRFCRCLGAVLRWPALVSAMVRAGRSHPALVDGLVGRVVAA